MSLGRKYMFDEAHALQVAKLSLLLFDQLRDIHKLGIKDRQILLAAGILHDIRSFIIFKRHYKHSLYIVSQSELPGFSQGEMQMIANISRYHRKSEPSLQHSTFSDLKPDERMRVSKLSAILRIADALDREHLQKITDLRREDDKGKTTISIKAKSDLLLERWAFQKKSQYFSDLFGLELDLKIER